MFVEILPVYVLFWWTGGLNGNVKRIPYVFAIQVKHEVSIKKFLVEAY